MLLRLDRGDVESSLAIVHNHPIPQRRVSVLAVQSGILERSAEITETIAVMLVEKGQDYIFVRHLVIKTGVIELQVRLSQKGIEPTRTEPELLFVVVRIETAVIQLVHGIVPRALRQDLSLRIIQPLIKDQTQDAN